MEYEENILLNNEIAGFIKSIKARHILLICDGVFTGNVISSSRYRKNNSSLDNEEKNYPSRTVMTSGVLNEIPATSVFFKYLYQRLSDNSKPILSASALFNKIEEPVMNNSNNIPQFSVLKNAGDEGGKFIFVKKN